MHLLTRFLWLKYKSKQRKTAYCCYWSLIAVHFALQSSILWMWCRTSNLKGIIICICWFCVTDEDKDQTVNPLVSGPSACTCLVRWLKKNKTTYHTCAQRLSSGNYQRKKNPDRNVQEPFICGDVCNLFKVLCFCLWGSRAGCSASWCEYSATLITTISNKNEKGCVYLLYSATNFHTLWNLDP